MSNATGAANPFEAYGEDFARAARGRRTSGAPPKAASPPPSAAERAIREREALARHYRRASKARMDEVFAAEPRLKDFRAGLLRFSTLDDAEPLVEFVRATAAQWLRHAAHEDFRFAALRLISDRIFRIRTAADLPPFDDPMPEAWGGDEPADDVFRICKRELGL